MSRRTWTLLLAGLVAGACGSVLDPSHGDGIERGVALEVRHEAGVVLLTQILDPEVVMDALFSGPVQQDARGCVRLAGPDAQTVVWPRGFSAQISADRVEILDDQGVVVGGVGADFVFAGGEVSDLHSGLGFTSEDRELASASCPGKFWIVAPGTVTSG